MYGENWGVINISQQMPRVVPSYTNLLAVACDPYKGQNMNMKPNHGLKRRSNGRAEARVFTGSAIPEKPSSRRRTRTAKDHHKWGFYKWGYLQNQSQMLHGAGIFTYIWAMFRINVGKYSSTMVRIWEWFLLGKTHL